MAIGPNTPYWLIREPGKEHGIGTVDLDSAITSDRALEVYRTLEAPKWADYYDLWALPLEASLVVLTYVNGQPVVKEVA